MNVPNATNLELGNSVNTKNQMLPIQSSNYTASSINSIASSSSQTNKATEIQILSKNDIKTLVQKLNETIKQLNDSVRFSYSEDIKALVVKVVDSKTGQVIRQIPPEELIKLEASLSQSIGIIFNKEVK